MTRAPIDRVKMALAVIVATLLLAAVASCAWLDDQYAACGEWPYRVVLPVESERVAEVRYAQVLAFARESESARFLIEQFAMSGAPYGYFTPGERLEPLRHGDVDSAHVLVLRHNERFWTTEDELCDG